MHPVLTRVAKDLGLENALPTIQHNAIFSKRIVEDCRKFLQAQQAIQGIPFDVVVLGSLGREEASATSDFDYLVIAHELPHEVSQSRELLQVLASLNAKIGLDGPGPTRMFGRVVSAPDLTEFIGLEEDTNRSLTHRILVLGESVSIYQPDRHRTLIMRIIERYLADYPSPKRGVPRFLLNDALRYWRTLAVDYQAKRWEQVGRQDGHSSWGLRYLKLLISRKTSFAGFIIPLLLCDKAESRYLFEQFEMPALARLVQVYDRDPNVGDAVRTILKVSEEFAVALADESFREELKNVEAPAYQEKWPARFRSMRKRADDLQEALEYILFESATLQKKARRYLSF